ncbi:MAG: hypothetical protein R3345_03425, partial [Fulvivirga sp.]|nr:hypothetical protein [Fulvivirga sp.]
MEKELLSYRKKVEEIFRDKAIPVFENRLLQQEEFIASVKKEILVLVEKAIDQTQKTQTKQPKPTKNNKKKTHQNT